MKKINIITINDNNNYGNRLQNYAVQEFLKKQGFEVKTIRNYHVSNKKEKSKLKTVLRYIKSILVLTKREIVKKVKKDERYKKFKEFNKNIKFSRKLFSNIKIIDNFNKNDVFVVGSDQVWNPNFNHLTSFELLEFIEESTKIAFSASFGISKLPEKYEKETAKALNKFNAISVREDSGKKIVEKLTDRKNVQVLVDPTMLISSEEWEKVSKKPKQLKTDKYILNYFLGNLSDKRKKEIERIAKENNCEIINILDKNSPFYSTGPSEFLYLEKNAFLICTDSFHSCVFAILYERPFLVFEREDKKVSMNSRLETLLSTFKLENRYLKENVIKDELLKCDYTKSYKILEKEQEKAKDFIKSVIK